MPKISVIIPTYGKPVYLEKSIQSVINQTINDWELIIVDDNNPDTEARTATEEIVSVFCKQDQRITYIKHEKNKNGAVARNTGIKAANGEYIAFLDSDDEYMPTRFEKCLMAMGNALMDVAGVYTGCEFRKGGKTYKLYTGVKNGNFLVDTLACRFMFCTGSNIFVKKSIVDELNGFDGAFLRHQDYEFLARIFEKYKLAAISEVLVIKNNENFNLPNVKKMIDIKKQYLDKFDSVIKKQKESDQLYIYHNQYIEIAELAVSSGEKQIASEYYTKAKETGGLSIKEIARRIACTVMRKK